VRKSLEAGLSRLENVLMFGALMGALTIGVVQVILRYVFRTGIVWSELAIVTLTILAAFVGGSRAAANAAHVRVVLFAQWLGVDARRYLEVIAGLVSVAYCCFMGYASLLFVSFLRETGAVASEADIPLWIIYAIAPFSMLLFTVRFTQRIPKAWSGVSSETTEVID
jgi:TRAP-type C4-dicarboxylate transport system permease small subunit